MITFDKLSIVIPAYNEEKRIRGTLESYCSFFKLKVKTKEISDFEIVVVLNNTTDRTLEITKQVKKKYSEIVIKTWWKRIRNYRRIQKYIRKIKIR